MKKLLAILLLLSAPAVATEIAHVEHGTDSVILRFPLWDVADPKLCATDITNATTGLEINVSTDVSDGYEDTFTQAASTINAITTIGTFATPDANDANFEIIVAGSCMYELQLANAIFDTVGATVLNLEIVDGNTQIIDHFYTVDLTVISAATVVDLIWDEAGGDHVAAGSTGAQLETVLNAVFVDTDTTLDSAINTISLNTSYQIFAAESADSGNTTTLVDADELSQGDDYWNDWSALVVEFAGGSQIRCVRDFDDASATLTVSPAYDTSITTEAYRLIAAPACLQTGDSFARLGANGAGLTDLATASALSTHDGKLDTVDGIVDTILLDTDEMQGDLVNAGRLDVIFDAIKATTDQFTFTVEGEVDSNAESMNAVEILGSGTAADPWNGE